MNVYIYTNIQKFRTEDVELGEDREHELLLRVHDGEVPQLALHDQLACIMVVVVFFFRFVGWGV